MPKPRFDLTQIISEYDQGLACMRKQVEECMDEEAICAMSQRLKQLAKPGQDPVDRVFSQMAMLGLLAALKASLEAEDVEEPVT